MEIDILKIVISLLAFIIGILFGRFYRKKSPDGYFRINTTDPMKDVFTIEYSTDPRAFINQKELIFKVIVEDFGQSFDAKTASTNMD